MNEKNDLAFNKHILDSINAIEEFSNNLSKEELEKAKKRAEEKIRALLDEINTKVFLFSLTKKQIESLNKFSEKIDIIHLSKDEWELFTEDFVYNTNAIEGSTVMEEEVPKIHQQIW